MSLKFLPANFDFNKLEIYKKALQANTVLAELNNAIAEIPNFELLLQPLTAREAVASSEIENIRTTTLELLQAEIMPVSQLTVAQKETLNYKKALKSGYDNLVLNQKITTDDIVQIQAQIAPEKNGIRTKAVYIANRLGEFIYTPPEHTQLSQYLENFGDYFNTNDDLDVLINMAITHYQFESIHPFLDGNGRTGRILMVLFLTLKNRLKYPVLFLSNYILQYKSYYYQLFNEVHQQNNWSDWVIFILNGVELQAIETLEKIHKIKAFEAEILKIVQINFKNSDIAKFSNYLLSKAFYTQTNLSQTLQISRPTAKRYLEKLQEIGVCDSRRSSREKLYFMPEFLDILA